MSFAQQGMWLLQQTLPDPAAYNVPTAVHLSGLVDRERVQRSLRVILERHEVLRTGLVQQGKTWCSKWPPRGFSLPWREVNLRSASIPEQASALQQILEEEACQAFDLAQPPCGESYGSSWRRMIRCWRSPSTTASWMIGR